MSNSSNTALKFESMPDDLEFAASTTHTIMDWMTCWRVVIAVGNENADIQSSLSDEDAEVAHKAVLTLMKKRTVRWYAK